MNWFLGICVWVLLALCVVLSGRVKHLERDLAWWREEAMRLSNEVGKWCRVASECQQKANKLTQERAESIAGYMAQLKSSICEMDGKCPLNNKVE